LISINSAVSTSVWSAPNVWEDKSDIDVSDALLAGSVFLGADTGIGPIFLGYGLAEGGTSSFYLYIGALRNDPSLR
jgi:hypothetical protein